VITLDPWQLGASIQQEVLPRVSIEAVEPSSQIHLLDASPSPRDAISECRDALAGRDGNVSTL